MTHEISVLGCGAIYIDNERVFGSKPYGLFSTVNWSATDEDLNRIADRCLELMANRKTENCSEIPNNCETCRHKGEEGCEQPCLGCGCCDFYEPKTEPTGYNLSPVDKDINVRSKDEPQTDCQWK